MGGDGPRDWTPGWVHLGCTHDGLETFVGDVGVDGCDSSEDVRDLVLDDCRKT